MAIGADVTCSKRLVALFDNSASREAVRRERRRCYLSHGKMLADDETPPPLPPLFVAQP